MGAGKLNLGHLQEQVFLTAEPYLQHRGLFTSLYKGFAYMNLVHQVLVMDSVELQLEMVVTYVGAQN